jgi:hypothetical protein
MLDKFAEDTTFVRKVIAEKRHSLDKLINDTDDPAHKIALEKIRNKYY